jgi:hypothetical protein
MNANGNEHVLEWIDSVGAREDLHPALDAFRDHVTALEARTVDLTAAFEQGVAASITTALDAVVTDWGVLAACLERLRSYGGDPSAFAQMRWEALRRLRVISARAAGAGVIYVSRQGPAARDVLAQLRALIDCLQSDQGGDAGTARCRARARARHDAATWRRQRARSRR